MNAIDKSQLQGSLKQLQAKLSVGKTLSQTAAAMAGGSVTAQGIPVQIPAIAQLSQAVSENNKCLDETLKILDKVLDKL